MITFISILFFSQHFYNIIRCGRTWERCEKFLIIRQLKTHLNWGCNWLEDNFSRDKKTFANFYFSWGGKLGHFTYWAGHLLYLLQLLNIIIIFKWKFVNFGKVVWWVGGIINRKKFNRFNEFYCWQHLAIDFFWHVSINLHRHHGTHLECPVF